MKYGKVSVKAMRALGVQEASGLAPAADGAFWLCTDGKGMLYQLELEA